MKKFMDWLETSFSPRMAKINNNVWILTLKDSIMQILPFIFLGSVFVLLAVLKDFLPWLPDFWVPFGWTMGLVSLFMAFLIPFNLMEKKKLRKQRLIAGLASVSLFLIIISPQVIKDGAPGFGHSSLGAGGMFIAIVAGLFSGWVMGLFGKFSFFKDESALPDFVRAWFDAMLPIAVVIVAGWVAVDLLQFDVYNILQAIFSPLGAILETPWGFSLWMFIHCFLYSMGISGWVLEPIQKPILLAAITANMAGAAANLVTAETIYSAYLWIGGVAATLPLVILLAMSRSKRLKALGRASLVPGIFNINEPVVFGAVVWNPILMIPMWIQGLVLPLLVWLFTKVIPLAPIPSRLFDLWYVPFPISTWLSTGSFTAILLALIIFATATAIWYPFFKAYEKQTLAAETAEARDLAAA